ncbi:MAG: hypothetical protein GY943_15170 [Chloroflexi bacterium]|nr:hypothetical protein [Chloroflexota bacterium]
MSRRDTIFNLQTPLIFAHRGGAGEAPESTIDGFLHGLSNGADVLELDVQLTKDGQLMVWHGPKLDVAFDEENKLWKDVIIGDCWWQQLRELWVSHPVPPGSDLERRMERYERRRMLTLQQFLIFVLDVKRGTFGKQLSERPFHLNIELKEPSGAAPKWSDKNEKGMIYLRQFLDMLNDHYKPLGKHPEPDTIIVVVSEDHDILENFRELQKNVSQRQYKTSLSAKEQKAYGEYFGGPLAAQFVGDVVGAIYKEKKDLSNYAFQTVGSLVTKPLVDIVHERGGGIYPFLTDVPFLSELEPEDGSGVGNEAYIRELKHLIAMGVDGVMTDYPSIVNRILRR